MQQNAVLKVTLFPGFLAGRRLVGKDHVAVLARMMIDPAPCLGEKGIKQKDHE
jgi:hypothetical protein